MTKNTRVFLEMTSIDQSFFTQILPIVLHLLLQKTLVFVNNRDIQSNIADATEIMIHESILVNKLWDSYFFKLN